MSYRVLPPVPAVCLPVLPPCTTLNRRAIPHLSVLRLVPFGFYCHRTPRLPRSGVQVRLHSHGLGLPAQQLHLVVSPCGGVKPDTQPLLFARGSFRHVRPFRFVCMHACMPRGGFRLPPPQERFHDCAAVVTLLNLRRHSPLLSPSNRSQRVQTLPQTSRAGCLQKTICGTPPPPRVPPTSGQCGRYWSIDTQGCCLSLDFGMPARVRADQRNGGEIAGALGRS